MKTKTKRIKRAVRRHEERASTTYQTPAEWLMDILVGDRGAAGVTVNERTCLNAATVFACVRNLSEDIAKLPLMLYEKSKSGREHADGNPLYDLLHDAPNPEMSSMDFRQACMVDLLLGGNAYSEIIINGAGMPVAIYKLNRNTVTPKRAPTGQIVYVVHDPVKGESILPQDRVLHFRGTGDDGLAGWSIIKLAKQTIGLSLATEKNSESFFGRSSLPSGVLQLKSKMDPKAVKNLRESWEALHAGPDNSHKIAILEEGMTFNPMSISPDDAQFIESREFSVEDICRWFRMPPHKVGHLKRASGWSTLEATNTDYVIDTLFPWAVRIEHEMERKLLPPSERRKFYIEHKFDALTRGDTAARSAFYESQFRIGAISQNEIRGLENRNSIGPAGDTYYVPTQIVPSDIAAKGPQPVVPPQPMQKQQEQQPAGATDGATRQKRLELIERGFVDTLSREFGRVLRVEQDKIRRASKKPDFRTWASAFFEDHRLHVRAAIGGVMEAFTASAFATLADSAPNDALLKAVGDEMNKIAERHTSASLAEMADAGKVENWMARAEPEAKAELANVSKMILEFAGKEV